MHLNNPYLLLAKTALWLFTIPALITVYACRKRIVDWIADELFEPSLITELLAALGWLALKVLMMPYYLLAALFRFSLQLVRQATALLRLSRSLSSYPLNPSTPGLRTSVMQFYKTNIKPGLRSCANNRSKPYQKRIISGRFYIVGYHGTPTMAAAQQIRKNLWIHNKDGIYFGDIATARTYGKYVVQLVVSTRADEVGTKPGPGIKVVCVKDDDYGYIYYIPAPKPIHPNQRIRLSMVTPKHIITMP